jgi:NhaP-type Na+/H+ or K+/H+ antiporter
VAKKTEPKAPSGIHRIERALAYAAASVVGLGVVCIVIILVAALSGHGNSNEGIWPTVSLLPVIAFPIGILLVIGWVVVSIIRRTRETRSTTR